jgi:hypothetical protein
MVLRAPCCLRNRLHCPVRQQSVHHVAGFSGPICGKCLCVLKGSTARNDPQFQDLRERYQQRPSVVAALPLPAASAAAAAAAPAAAGVLVAADVAPV